MADDPDVQKRLQVVVTPESVKNNKQQRMTAVPEEATAEASNPARELFTAESSKQGRYKTYYGQSADKTNKPDPRWKHRKETMEERSTQAAIPQTAKKAKDVPVSSAELTGKMEEQLKIATEVLGKMVSEISGEAPPPYIRDMQQQLVDMSENMKQLEKINEDVQYDMRDLEIFTASAHQALYRQQQQAAALQTVVKPWPTDFTDDDRDNVIQYYAAAAEVEKLMSTTHGKTVYGRYMQSPVSIIHWQSEKAKADFEYYTYRKFNKRYPATIWDRNTKTVYHHSGEAHRIIFTTQVSEMERDINLVVQAALHIITKHDESDLANSWGKVAVKWQEMLAIRNEDNAVIFKLVRSDEDPKFLHLHVHRQYYETGCSAWSWG